MESKFSKSNSFLIPSCPTVLSTKNKDLYRILRVSHPPIQHHDVAISVRSSTVVGTSSIFYEFIVDVMLCEV